jgi:large conductance mechanosensitive channel
MLMHGERRMLDEFKKFALRGNVVDLAVGIVIGAAFGAVVNSLVNDLVMPLVGAASGGLDFSNYYVPLSSKVQAGLAYADAKKQGAVFGYGNFITVVISFLIIALCLFFIIRAMNMLVNREVAKLDPGAKVPPPLSPEANLLTQIRDLLQERTVS